ncbi:MAG: TerD family protein, partial [Bacilli bacterium]
MSISLQKGQKVDLTKGNAGLSKLLVGLGWDPVKTAGGGGLFGFGKTKTANVDCDASVFMLEEGDRLTNKQDIIYFGNLKSACQSLQHSGDNTTGAGDGDDEQIMVDLNKIPSRIQKLIFVVNIYDCKNRKQDFGMIQN